MADRVIVLDQGTVREQGSFDELVATEGGLLGELYALSQETVVTASAERSATSTPTTPSGSGTRLNASA